MWGRVPNSPGPSRGVTVQSSASWRDPNPAQCRVRNHIMTTQRFDPLPARDQQTVIAQVINGFLAGDPIWSIAKATNMSSWETMNLLSRRIAERGEEERSKGLRHRCS